MKSPHAVLLLLAAWEPVLGQGFKDPKVTRGPRDQAPLLAGAAHGAAGGAEVVGKPEPEQVPPAAKPEEASDAAEAAAAPNNSPCEDEDLTSQLDGDQVLLAEQCLGRAQAGTVAGLYRPPEHLLTADPVLPTFQNGDALERHGAIRLLDALVLDQLVSHGKRVVVFRRDVNINAGYNGSVRHDQHLPFRGWDWLVTAFSKLFCTLKAVTNPQVL